MTTVLGQGTHPVPRDTTLSRRLAPDSSTTPLKAFHKCQSFDHTSKHTMYLPPRYTMQTLSFYQNKSTLSCCVSKLHRGIYLCMDLHTNPNWSYASRNCSRPYEQYASQLRRSSKKHRE